MVIELDRTESNLIRQLEFMKRANSMLRKEVQKVEEEEEQEEIKSRASYSSASKGSLSGFRVKIIGEEDEFFVKGDDSTEDLTVEEDEDEEFDSEDLTPPASVNEDDDESVPQASFKPTQVAGVSTMMKTLQPTVFDQAGRANTEGIEIQNEYDDIHIVAWDKTSEDHDMVLHKDSSSNKMKKEQDILDRVFGSLHKALKCGNEEEMLEVIQEELAADDNIEIETELESHELKKVPSLHMRLWSALDQEETKEDDGILAEMTNREVYDTLLHVYNQDSERRAFNASIRRVVQPCSDGGACSAEEFTIDETRPFRLGINNMPILIEECSSEDSKSIRFQQKRGRPNLHPIKSEVSSEQSQRVVVPVPVLETKASF